MYPPVGSARVVLSAPATAHELSTEALNCMADEGSFEVVRALRVLIHGPHGGVGHVSDDFVLAINANTAKFDTGAGKVVIQEIEYTISDQQAETFAANWTIALNKFGCIAVYVEADGTVHTLAGVVTGVDISYDTAAEALDAIPHCPADTVLIGYIAIDNDGTLWTANTDDLTNGSDVDTAVFVNFVSPDVVVEARQPHTTGAATESWHAVVAYVPLALGSGGMQSLLELAGWKGIRIRVRSNGITIDQEISAFWSS